VLESFERGKHGQIDRLGISIYDVVVAFNTGGNKYW
jgi:hypothetical protein